MAKSPRLMPSDPRMFTAQVVSSTRLSPSFQRVTIASDELAAFDWRGLDHWFRLFFPLNAEADLQLPDVSGGLWWKSYLAIPDDKRPHCSNYTVAGYRRLGDHAELDIDVVLHWNAGRLGGVAAWAASTQPGSPVGILDQGVLFDPPAGTSSYLLVADESGLPAVRGILRGLPADAVGTAIIEVPAPEDAAPVEAPPGVRVCVVARNETEHCVGTCALQALAEVDVPGEDAYAFVVGESNLATQGRRALCKAGLPKDRITFSGFWKA